ncbi:hypothetical protein NPIL_240361 [Nephila pilipes]|uniref:Uncharacterized protein n=1 Tax=Nephila pilipes TaxID=299642 RepID=A0A8X6IK01_NEPPI|nr:hypothetical protein NPIL_240361 [Nephila pilipes]
MIGFVIANSDIDSTIRTNHVEPQLHHLLPAVRRKPSRSLLDKLSISLHDNAHCHGVTLQEVLELLPYSPEMRSWDLNLFPHLKVPLRYIPFPDMTSVL